SSVRCPVHAINESAGSAKLDRQEVSSRNVLTFPADAILIRATPNYLLAPEVEPRFIRLAPEEVEIVLADKVLRCIEWVLEVAACERSSKGSVRAFAKLSKRSLCSRDGV